MSIAIPGQDPGHRWSRDVAVALACAVLSVVLVMIVVASDGAAVATSRQWTVAGLLCLQSAVLLLRSRMPTAVLVATSVVQVVVTLLLPVDIDGRGPALLVAGYTVGTVTSPRRAIAIVVGVVALETAAVLALPQLVGVDGQVRGPADGLAHGLTALLNLLAATLVGVVMGTRRAYDRLVASRAEDRVAAERARADRAVSDERARMAREVHDVAAHHLTGMVVQAGAVEQLIGRDEDAARAATRELREQGRRTLDDLRTAVGILRDATATSEAQVPGVHALPELVVLARRTGPVTLDVVGEAVALPPLADVTVHRVVQEALSNARQHAPGAPVDVTLTWSHDRVEVEVLDHGAATRGARGRTIDASTHGGFGLLGMRERATLLDGCLDAGPTPSGGWRVLLRLPVATPVTGVAS